MNYKETTIEEILMANYDGITTIDEMFEVFGEKHLNDILKTFILEKAS